jgi:hypothetical protein
VKEKRCKLIGQIPMENLPCKVLCTPGTVFLPLSLGAKPRGRGTVKREGGTKMLSHARNAIRDCNIAM